jgi:hypothetical protein
MERIHLNFHECLMQALIERHENLENFKRRQNYSAVLAEIKSHDAPFTIVAVALRDLCDGTVGPSDRAVISAVFQFLNDECGEPCDDPDGGRRLADLQQIFGSSRHAYEKWARHWYGMDY